MSSAIAIVGMSCRYADARSPAELWENVLAERRAFRRIPAERLRLEDYFSDDRTIPDTIYSTQAAVIEGFEFDRVKFKVAGETFRATDTAHWLALDTAARAFEDADILTTLPRQRTGVFLGNTLTGEFSRANNLRLRYPFIKRVVESVLGEENDCREKLPQILENLERAFKEPFPPITEDSLAGSLSNTIAGRICNYFDLQGGGFTVDGACSSSLLAIANACSALIAGDIDAALAGGVDLSLDPFELVGFAKIGALAPDVMRVFDTRSNGFLPGEGCGFVLLMREEEAVQRNLKIYALIKGWGISSDGNGGITRPEVEGQFLALQRAYLRAGFDIGSVPYFEGHGTGTTIGDATELKALSKARREACAKTKAVVGSIKTIVGHTKAAAGIAGLLKATSALHNEILPPTTGCETPHAEISGENSVLKILRQAEVWSENEPLRAGVSSFGFGGINAHVVLEKKRESAAKRKLSSRDKVLVSSSRDGELFLLSAETVAELIEQIKSLLNFAAQLSFAELGDLAATLAHKLENKKIRVALVASSPKQLAEKFDLLLKRTGESHFIDVQNSVFYGAGNKQPRIGFLFSGQGSPLNSDGGLWRRRFDEAKEIYRRANLECGADQLQTRVAQPAIVAASIAALRILEKFDVTAQTAVGHSLGEITALHWAGAFDENTLLRIAEVRGRAMSETCSVGRGAMLSVSAGKNEIESFLQNENVVVAALNAPRRTVLSGETAAIETLQNAFRAKSIAAIKLPVSHAFHSPLVADSAPVLAEHLATEDFQSLEKDVFSTVTGAKLSAGDDLHELLFRQITSPVRFSEAIENADKTGVDLWIEVGTGGILRGLVGEMTRTPAIALEAGSESLNGLWQAVGACFVLGQPINQDALCNGRYTKPFDLNWKPKFFVNPCEFAPSPSGSSFASQAFKAEKIVETKPIEVGEKIELAAIELVTKLIAERTELPIPAVKVESRMLSDLHLNSISVGQIVTTAARMLGAESPLSPTNFADASVAEIAEVLEKLKEVKDVGGEKNTFPAGIDVWVRPFRVELTEKPLTKRKTDFENGDWDVFAPPEYPSTERLKNALANLPGSGAIVCLPLEANENHISLLLESAKRISEKKGQFFVLLQHGKSAAAFARTFALENPHLKTVVVNVPLENEKSVEWISNEISSSDENFVEAFYDAHGRRFEPIVQSIKNFSDGDKINLSSEDVLVVTGGGKGITAECVLALAKETNVRVALIGSSKPENDGELANNLARFKAREINFKYYSADITDADAVQTALQKIKKDFGEVTAVLHAAARNEPCLINNLTEEKFAHTLAVKLTGAKNLLAAVKPEKLKLFITFGSIIARTGLPGESDYGLANEWLRQLTEEFQSKNPQCRCLAIEWSVWSGVGMGAKVANLEMLERQGITPISLETGVETFLQLLKAKNLPTSFVAMSRFPDAPTFKVERPELPFLRFLEEPKVYYPNIELICDVELSATNDPYLNDHQIQGERLLPAVFGMEAMAQVASALLGEKRKPTFHQLQFNRPVVVKENEPHKIRISSLAREDGTIEIAIQSAETNFSVNHFQGICHFENETSPQKFELNGQARQRVNIEPAQDLYGKILFHAGRFRRLSCYLHLEARESLARIEPQTEATWFSQFLPREFLLGDPAMRDAAIHSIQACIPHAALLPVSVDKVSMRRTNGDKPCLIHAKEVSQDGDVFTYDLEMLNLQGEIYETWQGLRLQTVNGSNFQGDWNLPLLTIFLERKFAEMQKETKISFALLHDDESERQTLSDRAIQKALGEKTKILRRRDGKPETANGKFVSASHAEKLTFAVAGKTPVSCDIEKIVERSSEAWADLLGEIDYKTAQRISSEAAENFQVSATRIWSARECLKKISAGSNGSLSLEKMEMDGSIILSMNNSFVYSYPAQFTGQKTILSVLVKKDENSV